MGIIGTEAKTWVKCAAEEINDLYFNYMEDSNVFPPLSEVEDMITKWSLARRPYHTSSLYDKLKELLDEYTQ